MKIWVQAEHPEVVHQELVRNGKTFQLAAIISSIKENNIPYSQAQHASVQQKGFYQGEALLKRLITENIYS